MKELLVNITRRTTAIIAVAAVIMLNLSSVIQCVQMLIEDDCCHITNTVKPCCLKNVKITLNERFTGSCGCTMKEAQQPVDMYTDLLTGYHKNPSSASIELESTSTEIFHAYFSVQTAYYSPPLISDQSLYLTNMNLRI